MMKTIYWIWIVLVHTLATDILLRPAYTKDDFAARELAIKKLIAYADNKTVRSFLAEVLAFDDKLYMRFYNIITELWEN